MNVLFRAVVCVRPLLDCKPARRARPSRLFPPAATSWCLAPPPSMSLASIAAALDGSSRGSPPEVKPAIDPSTCRASPHHAPCQADAWSRRPPTLTDGWTLGHEAIRAEISKMEAVLHRLGERRLREWETRALKVRRRRMRACARVDFPSVTTGPREGVTD